MKHIEDYDLFDRDFEKFVQLGREAFADEGREEGGELGRKDIYREVFRPRWIDIYEPFPGSYTAEHKRM